MIRSELKRKAPAAEPKPAKGPRTVKCKFRGCLHRFVPNPDAPQVKWCSIECGTALALATLGAKKLKLAKADRAATKAKLKTRADWMREAQSAMNAWTRERDRLDGCISCDKPATWQGQWHASHYLSVGASPSTRFDPANLHKACSICNNHLSGNIRAYRPRLIGKIGLTEVERLEGPQPVRKYTVDDLNAIKTHYTQALKQLKMVA